MGKSKNIGGAPPQPAPFSPRAQTTAPAGELALLISGASGGALAARLATIVLEHAGLDTLHLVMTAAAERVLAVELGREWSTAAGFRAMIENPATSATRVLAWDDADLMAPIASGSHPLIGTVVLPCSAGTLRWAAVLAAGILLVWQHRLVPADDLSRVDAAFFAATGGLSVLMGLLFLAAKITGW